MTDTELLKILLGHLVITSDNIDWPLPDDVNGLREVGEDPEIIKAIAKRSEELL
jgi:hypothetical protein